MNRQASAQRRRTHDHNVACTWSDKHVYDHPSNPQRCMLRCGCVGNDVFLQDVWLFHIIAMGLCPKSLFLEAEYKAMVICTFNLKICGKGPKCPATADFNILELYFEELFLYNGRFWVLRGKVTVTQICVNKLDTNVLGNVRLFFIIWMKNIDFLSKRPTRTPFSKSRIWIKITNGFVSSSLLTSLCCRK